MGLKFLHFYQSQNMKFNFPLLVILVALLTILLRFAQLDTVPPHLSNDEISIAYDAYSVLKTGKDEHNHFLPLSFQSHSTYKAPLTIYLAIPTTILFGSTEIAVRLISALAGSLTTLILGFLVFELTRKKYLALLSSFILAISPMHILTSHMAYEANIALFFFTLGIYLFFLGLRKSSFITIASFISFALSVWAYHTEWIFTPFIIILLILMNIKSIKKQPRYYFGILLFLTIIVPILLDFLINLNSTTRASTENLLREPSLAIKLENPNFYPWQKVSFIISAFLEKYSSYFNLSYIFFTGYNLLPKADPFQAGVFLSPFLLFFLIGIYKVSELFKEKAGFIYALLITAPITASLTSGVQSTSRNLVSVIPISIVCAVGFFIFLKHANRIWKIFTLTAILVSFLYFLVIFFYHFPKDSGEGFQYGYKQIAQYIKPRYQNYHQIIIDPRFGPANMYAGLPHLYIPYYTNLNPNKLLESRRVKEGTFFDKYQIRNIDWDKEELKEGYLYIVPASNEPNQKLDLRKLHTITLPNFKPAFYLYSI